MCGRYSLTWPSLKVVGDWLEAEVDDEVASAYRPRFNAAPTDPLWIARVEGAKLRLGQASWGFPARGKVLFNARLETAAQLPSFRSAYRSSRCVALADAFYEWTGAKADRVPQRIAPADGLLLFAGIWEQYESRDVFCILTEPATGPLVEVHSRMPVMLTKEGTHQWLAGMAPNHLPRLTPDALSMRPVSKRLGNVREDDPRLLTTDAPAVERQLTLFR